MQPGRWSAASITTTIRAVAASPPAWSWAARPARARRCARAAFRRSTARLPLMLSEPASTKTATYADRLAEFTVNIQPEEIPDELIRQAELSTLDFFGVVLAGSATPAGQIIGEYARGQGGPAEASLIGSRDRVPVAAAALANGTRAHSVELDDHEAHMRSKVHPGVVIMPAAWAVAESTGEVSGLEFLTAV